MTNAEAKGVLGDVRAYLASRASLENEMLAGHTFTDICNAIKALEQPRWIPVSDPLNELPKDRMLYVTTEWGYVETLVWDMTEWDDADIARSTVAYMNHYEPQPYKAESEDAE